MVFLHLSDLHIGKKLGELPLLEDQRHIFDRILALCARERPDAAVIAGDLYDRAAPPAEAVALADDFLTALASAVPEVLVAAGNHDSPERLAFGRRFMRGVSMSPVFSGSFEPVRVADADFWLLPFFKPVQARAAYGDESLETYTQAVRAAVSHMALEPERANVLVTHQYVTGADRCDSESVGGGEGVDASVFDAFDYVALGHLHSPQHVLRDTVRYCGSPLKYSLSEASQEKSATLVERYGRADRVRTVPLEPLHEVRRLRGRYDDLTLRKNYEGTAVDDYLYITLTDEQDIPDAAARLACVYPNLVFLDYDNRRTRAALGADEDAPAAQSASPAELFASLYRRQNGAEMTAGQMRYVCARIDAVWKGEQA